MALTLEDADRAIGACAANNVALQVGFNRRFAADFAAAHDVITSGGIGTPQLLRSLTRDPGITADVASRVKPWTIFNETLIHDFDALLWLNPGARVVEVFAQADALVHPQYKEQGYLDTSMVQLRFDNGALASAEANFQATYGYDVRGEVFGSGGMVSAGEVTRTAMRHYSSPGVLADTPRVNIELFHDAYVAQLAHFADCILSGSARRSTVSMLATPWKSHWLQKNPWKPDCPYRCCRCRSEPLRFGGLCRDDVHRTPCRRTHSADLGGGVRSRDLELARQGPRCSGRHRGSVLLDDRLSSRRFVR